MQGFSHRPLGEAKGHYVQSSAKSLPRQNARRQNRPQQRIAQNNIGVPMSLSPSLLTAVAALSVAALGTTAMSTTAMAQTPVADSRLLTAEKMWALKRLGDPAISPDGSTAVVQVTTYDVPENKGLTDLWLVPVSVAPRGSSRATRPAIRRPR
jgi:hypothetical protein